MTSSRSQTPPGIRLSNSSGSSVRGYLVGQTPAHELDADLRLLVDLAEALDRLLLARGWKLDHEMAGLGALSWYWPPSGSLTGLLYASDAPDAHELEPVTLIALYPDDLRITAPYVVRVGDCTHSPDRQVCLVDLPAALDALEAHRYTPRPLHIC